MVKRILVGLGDRSYAASATKQAIRLARQFDAELAGITLFDVHRLENVGPVPIGAGAAATVLRQHRVQQAQEALQGAVAEFQSLCTATGLPHRILDAAGDPFEGLIAHARYYDLVVCGLKGLFGHGVVDEPPVELVRLVEGGVRPLIAVTDEDRQVRRVLIAYSGSAESAKTMKRFVQLRLWPQASVRIVTFGKTPEEARALLSDAAEYCRAHDLDPETEHIPKNPKHELLPYAKDHLIDLIVIGNSARSLLLRRVLGETALYAVEHAECPLFLSQ